MISRLPASPGKASVRRIDWMISLIFRSRVGALEDAVGQQTRPDQLLRDRGGAARATAQGVVGGRDDRERVEARVVPERVVLDARGGIDQGAREVVEVDDDPLLLAEARELDLARGVVDDRLLVELDVVQAGPWGRQGPRCTPCTR